MLRSRRTAIALVAIGATVIASAGSGSRSTANAAVEINPHDVNGDGFDDLMIGVPIDDNETGTIQVILGSSDGLTPQGDAIYAPGSGFSGEQSTTYRFGGAVERTDMNGDGFVDVIVAAPSFRSTSVYVMLGSADGPSDVGAFSFDSSIAETGSDIRGFGRDLHTADFNGDGFGDLAIGAELAYFDVLPSAGSVTVVLGSADGFDDPTYITQAGAILGQPEAFDRFGRALTAGDFNNDGYDDLAIGVRGESLGAIAYGGMVNVVYGSSAGLVTDGNQAIRQTGPIYGIPEFGDRFGDAVAAGDLNGDGFDDLVAGVPGEDVGEIANAGAINVVYGSAEGLSPVGNAGFSQSGIVAGSVEENDGFGRKLAIGDINGDGFDDVAVGVEVEDIGTEQNAGAVNILFGSAEGLTRSGNVIVSQAGPIAGTPETGDRFGSSLFLADFDGDGFDDLAVGSDESVNGFGRAGALNIVHGSATGLNVERNFAITRAGEFSGEVEICTGFGLVLDYALHDDIC